MLPCDAIHLSSDRFLGRRKKKLTPGQVGSFREGASFLQETYRFTRRLREVVEFKGTNNN